MTPRRTALALLAVALGGCGTWDPTRGISAKEHADAGARLELEGNWSSALSEFKAALDDLKLDVPGGRLWGPCYYEYGRCLGVMGRFQESQSYLEKALAFDQGHKGPVFEDLTELARLNFDQKKYLEAVEFYKLDFEILDQIDASRRSPGAYCDLLEEYAASLSAAARESESNLCRAKLVALTKEFPNRRSITDRTPYGKYLSGNSHSGDRTSH